MKFGKFLLENKIAEWEEFYINYRKLKKLIPKIKPNQTGTDWDLPPKEQVDELSNYFKTQALLELDKIERFYLAMERQLLERWVSILREFGNVTTEIPNRRKTVLKEQIERIYVALINLLDFCNLNYRGFVKICKKELKRMRKLFPDTAKSEEILGVVESVIYT